MIVQKDTLRGGLSRLGGKQSPTGMLTLVYSLACIIYF